MNEHASYLRLERYRLQELSAGDARLISEHLASCEACRACWAEVERDIELPELPALPALTSQTTERTAAVADLIELRYAASRLRTRRWLAWSASTASALAIAAAALLMLRPVDRGADERVPPARFRTKGGDVAIELVRRHGAGLAHDTDVFADGDAFKVLVTCPPPLAPHFDVVVYQAGRAHFPLVSGSIESCGNRRTLAGAFSLDGADDALVCVALDAQRRPSRAELRNGPSALPKLSVCTRVRPSATSR